MTFLATKLTGKLRPPMNTSHAIWPRRKILGAIAACAAASAAAFGTIDVSQRLHQHHRTLYPGMSGPDVAEVQIRVAGWIPADQRACSFLRVDGHFTKATEQAVRNFRHAYSLEAAGLVDDPLWSELDALMKPDGSTVHFNWSEFYPPDGYGFDGGSVPEKTVKENIRRLMFKLEALRLKEGSHPIYITAGFRRTHSRPLQENPIASILHTYGIAADVYTDVARTSLYRLAETCGFTGLGAVDQRTQHCDSREEYPEYSSPSCWWQSGTIG